MDEIWAVMLDYGYEGLREPQAAFLHETDAHEYAKHMAANHGSFRVVRVPLLEFKPARIKDWPVLKGVVVDNG